MHELFIYRPQNTEEENKAYGRFAEYRIAVRKANRPSDAYSEFVYKLTWEVCKTDEKPHIEKVSCEEELDAFETALLNIDNTETVKARENDIKEAQEKNNNYFEFGTFNAGIGETVNEINRYRELFDTDTSPERMKELSDWATQITEAANHEIDVMSKRRKEIEEFRKQKEGETDEEYKFRLEQQGMKVHSEPAVISKIKFPENSTNYSDMMKIESPVRKKEDVSDMLSEDIRKGGKFLSDKKKKELDDIISGVKDKVKTSSYNPFSSASSSSTSTSSTKQPWSYGSSSSSSIKDAETARRNKIKEELDEIFEDAGDEVLNDYENVDPFKYAKIHNKMVDERIAREKGRKNKERNEWKLLGLKVILNGVKIFVEELIISLSEFAREVVLNERKIIFTN